MELLCFSCSNLQYVDEEGSEHYHTLKGYPEYLEKKVRLLKYFLSYMTEHLLKVFLINSILLYSAILRPWPMGPSSNRKWTQVELAYRLALGGQTDLQTCFLSSAHKVQKKHFKADSPLFHWLVIG